jgi:Putative zinc-finger
MSCHEAKLLFSPYLDGAVTGNEMRYLTQHLASCASCRREYGAVQATQRLLSRMGPRKAPSDLALRLRVAISQEVARARRPHLDHLGIRVENILNAFMVPATMGLVTAIVVFVMLMGFLAPLQADNYDVPLMLYSAPQLQQSALGSALDTINDDSLVIEAYVDSNGRVQDYRILSGAKDDEGRLSQVKKNMLIFTTFTRFRPALSMGVPTSGHAVLSFSKISVKG